MSQPSIRDRLSNLILPATSLALFAIGAGVAAVGLGIIGAGLWRVFS